MKTVALLYGSNKTMTFETERLILRPWSGEDAEDLYLYAKDPRVGPAAGWPVHTSVQNSREIIESVLDVPESYAVCLKTDGRAVGSIGLLFGEKGNVAAFEPGEAELGFWIGVPFWGQGLIPEAARRLMRYAFEDLRLQRLWCGYYDGNEKSRRTQEKCGFQYKYSIPEKSCPLLNETRTEHVNCITREQWVERL